MTIDWWTLAIQAVNVAVLVALLGHFFWKPVAAMIEQRRAAETKALDDAKARRDEAVLALAEVAQTRAGFALERKVLLQQACDDADRVRTDRLDLVIREVAARTADAAAALAKDRSSAEAAWHDAAGQLALDIAARLCAPMDAPAMHIVFLDRLVTKIEAMPGSWRRSVQDSRAALELVSATSLTPGEASACRERIAALWDGACAIGLRVDPALVAGLELQGDHLLVSNSWRADLRLIGQELASRHGT